ncbi:glucose sorbosone dehydrogenase [Microbulbifer flavimaris]|uniref:Glucose sorbosone dehydrogenase n=1 Tax=Microbulbifer flavimaris TaxID=1781068 RepID=A0ABX4I0V6_9GAMM|nr:MULTISPECIES: PQQ-dependent sugar dehydrogenase [Microbulbifer]KUJ83869.1 glucose sorbosone dehydrogenase [Microbulbifer sp. ZGT114]PCO06045.1 glucose sorbosone dehydrogenase [Microbulbifer flavimaris]
MNRVALFLTRCLAVLTLTGGIAATAAEVVEERIDTDQHDFRIVRLASGLHHPWAVAQLPDGRSLVTERRGRLALVDNGKVTYLDGVPEVSAVGQGGLLDVVLHPQYGDGEHDWIYLTYSKAGDEGTATAMGRAKLKGDALTGFEELFVQDRFSQPGRHYGSRLAWREDGTLMMTIGDRGVVRERAQDIEDHAGSVLRLTASGEAPADNPFAGDKAGLDEIYSFGNRNIQGLVVTADDQVWGSEHAARGGDELNLIEAGKNYGWPKATRSKEYSRDEAIGVPSVPGVQDPQHYYEGRFAPSGLAQVESQYFPQWQGNLLAGGLGSEKLLRIVIDGSNVKNTEVLLDGAIGRIRDVRQAGDGYIYLLNDQSDAGLYRLEPVQ